jgi:hypothetical protein
MALWSSKAIFPFPFDILGCLFLRVVMSRVFMFGFKLVVLAPSLRCHFLFF